MGPDFIIGGALTYNSEANQIVIKESSYDNDIVISLSDINVPDMKHHKKHNITYIIIPYHDTCVRTTWVLSPQSFSDLVDIILKNYYHMNYDVTKPFWYAYDNRGFVISQNGLDNPIFVAMSEEMANKDIAPQVEHVALGISRISYGSHEMYMETSSLCAHILTLFEQMKKRIHDRAWKIDGRRLIFKNVTCNGLYVQFKRLNYSDIDAYSVSSDEYEIVFTTNDNRVHMIQFSGSDKHSGRDLAIELGRLLS